jgi:UDP-2-acetamido-3-amino-2,3-dideoxy-glucuronate N-acetyltransferase
MDVGPFAVVVGNPAQIMGSADAEVHRLEAHEPSMATTEQLETGGVTSIAFRSSAIFAGGLAVTELGKELPFGPRRFFVVHDVPRPHTGS